MHYSTEPKVFASNKVTTNTTVDFVVDPYKAIGDNKRAKYYPWYAPEDGIIITATTDKDNVCPACQVKLIPVDFKHRRCLFCRNYLVKENETVEDIVQIRKASSFYTLDLEMTKKNIYIWHRETTPNVFKLVKEADS